MRPSRLIYLAFLAINSLALAQPLTPPTAEDLARQTQLTRLLREAIITPDARTRDRVLQGLRKLRDPSLRPLFAQFSIVDEPVIRANGLLGLAELEPRRGLDLLAISKVTDTRLQGLVLLEALDDGLIPDHTLTELTGWSELHPSVRLVLAGRCVRAGRAFDRLSIEQLAKDPDPFTAVAAALVLKQASLEPALADRILRQAKSDIPTWPRERIESIAGFVATNRLTSAIDLLKEIDVRRGLAAGGDSVLADIILSAMLVAGPNDETIVARCTDRLSSTTPLAERNYFSLRVLNAGLELGSLTPMPIVETMTKDSDPLIRAMSDALRPLALGNGSDGASIATLASFRHPQTIDWMVRVAERRHWQDARTIRVAVVHAALTRDEKKTLDPWLARLTTLAVTALADDDPATLQRPLAEAISSGDSPMVRVLLAGILRSNHPRSGELVRQGSFEPRPAGPWPDADCAATALLAAIRHGEETADPLDRIRRLTEIANGSGSNPGQAGPSGLDEVLRVQAAWLALKGAGQDRVALARILSDLLARTSDRDGGPAAPSPRKDPP